STRSPPASYEPSRHTCTTATTPPSPRSAPPCRSGGWPSPTTSPAHACSSPHRSRPTSRVRTCSSTVAASVPRTSMRPSPDDRRTVAAMTKERAPALGGNRCTTCGTVYFPAASFSCRNPDCDGTAFEPAGLSRRGTVWSYTDARYQPPPPFVPRTDPYEPFAIAAVELPD